MRESLPLFLNSLFPEAVVDRSEGHVCGLLTASEGLACFERPLWCSGSGCP